MDRARRGPGRHGSLRRSGAGIDPSGRRPGRCLRTGTQPDRSGHRCGAALRADGAVHHAAATRHRRRRARRSGVSGTGTRGRRSCRPPPAHRRVDLCSRALRRGVVAAPTGAIAARADRGRRRRIRRCALRTPRSCRPRLVDHGSIRPRGLDRSRRCHRARLPADRSSSRAHGPAFGHRRGRRVVEPARRRLHDGHQRPPSHRGTQRARGHRAARHRRADGSSRPPRR